MLADIHWINKLYYLFSLEVMELFKDMEHAGYMCLFLKYLLLFRMNSQFAICLCGEIDCII